MQVRVRLGAGLSTSSGAPRLTLDVPDGSTVADVLGALERGDAELSRALPSALAVVDGEHAARGQRLRHGQEIALVLPMSGG